MTDNTGNAKLFSKMAQVMSRVRTLKKDGRNQFDKYDYLTADSISIRIGELLAEKGIAFLPSITNVETNEYQTQKGGTNFRSVVTIQVTFACTETGATWTSLWSGEAIDRSDKSISKATVSAIKYALTKTFLLAGGDEEDADASSPVVEGKPQAIQKPATAPKNAVDGDVLFMPETTQHGSPVASEAQLKRLHAVGREFYGNEWDEQRPKLVQAVSTGAVSSANDLTPSEADKLIKGIQKKMAEVAERKAHHAQAVAA